MELKIFNTTEDEIKSRKFNIFIGISIGIKPLDEEMAKDYIRWALENTKDDVVILIADDIAKYNYRIFSSYSEEKSLKRARREGDEHITLFKEVISNLGADNRVRILRWKQIFDKKLSLLTDELKKEFDANIDFQKEILKFVNDYTKRRGKALTKEKRKYLANYILYELPTIFNGIEYSGNKYDLLFYPTFKKSGMGDFVMDIRNSKLFPKLREKLKLKKSMAIVECFVNSN